MRVSRSLVPSLLALVAAGCADPGALAPRDAVGTAESWCRDQPRVLTMRVVESGNIQVGAE